MPLARCVEYIGADGVPDLSVPSYLYLYIFLSIGVRTCFIYCAITFDYVIIVIKLLAGSLFVLVAETLVEDS